MKLFDHFLYLTGSFFISYLLVSLPTQAQIDPDNTLPIPTNVNVNKVDNILEISGGTPAAINLFHSFAEFSVIDGDTARFINNNPAIQNVISRVTGASPSKIFGKIEAGGSAPNFSLFLLNPNGIIFGPNASLDIKGSFVATTANAIQFGDRGFFSASSPDDPSLLTVQPSAFFFNQVRPNSIRNQSRYQTEMESGDPISVGLEVPNGKSLLLLGGDVIVDGGMLTASNGRVELGGLAGTGTVVLNIDDNNLSLSFPDATVRADVLLTNGATVNVVDKGGGSIAINAQNIEISNHSEVNSGILPGNKSDGSNPGVITLNATETVVINDSFVSSTVGSVSNHDVAIGNSGDVLIKAKNLDIVGQSQLDSLITKNGRGNSGTIIFDVQGHVILRGNGSRGPLITTSRFSDIEGKGGNITIRARSLSMSDSSAIVTSTLGKGEAGNIIIRVKDIVSLEKSTESFNTQIRTTVESGAIANGGMIDIQAHSLLLKDGSQILSSIVGSSDDLSGGQGQGGGILVNSDLVSISGTGNGSSSGIFAETEAGAVGPAGNITINTNFFSISDGAVINAQTENSGSGGNIRINSNTFEAINGGQLITTADSSGDAGSITVNTTERVTLSGNDPTFTDRRAQFGTDVVSNIGANSGLFARSDSSAAGDVTINTPQLRVQEGAEVNVSSSQGLAGELTINANSLFLNQGNITAETEKSGGEEGANIILKISDLFRIENESQISARAIGSADGGNIDIDTPLLIVFPPTGSNGSDIIATAEEGNGGNIIINAQGIFGIAERTESQGNQTNDIDASSEFGASGQVEINNTIDPNRGLIELPETVVDPNALVAQNPCKLGSESEFVITGRGGLPPSLSEDLSSEATQVGLVEPAPIESREAREQRSGEAEDKAIFHSSVPTTIIPAQGWVFNERGEVVLVAYDPIVTGSQRLRSNREGCSSGLSTLK